MVAGKIENLVKGPLELELVPELYLSSKSSNAWGDSFWAPVDLFHDAPLATDRRPTDKKGLGVAIETRPIRLRLQQSETVNFKIDARHVRWAKRISSVWPSFNLFSAVKSDVYDLQLVLQTNSGTVSSNKVVVKIDVSKSPPQ